MLLCCFPLLSGHTPDVKRPIFRSVVKSPSFALCHVIFLQNFKVLTSLREYNNLTAPVFYRVYIQFCYQCSSTFIFYDEAYGFGEAGLTPVPERVRVTAFSVGVHSVNRWLQHVSAHLYPYRPDVAKKYPL